MTTFFLVCAITGGAALVLQLVAGIAGFASDAADADLSGAEQGLNLLSVRALSAGLAFLGVGGLLGMSTPLGAVLAWPLGIAAGAAAMAGVAWITRSMLRLEDDGTVRLEGALGMSATVYLGIPAEHQGRGKIHLTLQNRTVEVDAVTRHGSPIPTGARVMVVDLVAPSTVEVVPDPVPQLEGSDVA